jgi:hypothetical protein
VLLLGKSASNWLKLQELVILPGCGDDDVSTSDSSGYEVSLGSAEFANPGWWHKKPRIDEISFVPCDTFDESQSDDENL